MMTGEGAIREDVRRGETVSKSAEQPQTVWVGKPVDSTAVSNNNPPV